MTDLPSIEFATLDGKPVSLEEVVREEEKLFSALNPELAYVDATEATADIYRRLGEQEQLITKLMAALQTTQNAMLATQKSVLRAHEEIMVLKSNAPAPSALILPDRLNS